MCQSFSTLHAEFPFEGTSHLGLGCNMDKLGNKMFPSKLALFAVYFSIIL